MKNSSYSTVLSFQAKNQKRFLPYFAENAISQPEAVDPVSGEPVDIGKPELYLDFYDARKSAEILNFTGIAMRLGDGYFSITIENCLAGDYMLKHAEEICSLAASYTELNPEMDSSIQILCGGNLPEDVFSGHGISFANSGLFFFSGKQVGSYSTIRNNTHAAVEIFEHFIKTDSFFEGGNSIE